MPISTLLYQFSSSRMEKEIANYFFQRKKKKTQKLQAAGCCCQVYLDDSNVSKKAKKRVKFVNESLIILEKWRDSHTNFLNVLDLKCLKLISTPLCTAFGILPVIVMMMIVMDLSI
jgi:hypothetical protein